MQNYWGKNGATEHVQSNERSVYWILNNMGTYLNAIPAKGSNLE